MSLKINFSFQFPSIFSPNQAKKKKRIVIYVFPFLLFSLFPTKHTISQLGTDNSPGPRQAQKLLTVYLQNIHQEGPRIDNGIGTPVLVGYKSDPYLPQGSNKQNRNIYPVQCYHCHHSNVRTTPHSLHITTQLKGKVFI